MGQLKPWREIRREQVADCRIFEVERSIAESPFDGLSHDYYRILSADWVQIVPITPADEIVMVRQYRHGSESYVLEVPGGLVDTGEQPVEAALRECREETGYLAREASPIADLNPNPAIHNHRLYSFFARDVEKVGEIQNTATEHTVVELVPIASVAGLLRSGKIDHALVASTLWEFLHDHA